MPISLLPYMNMGAASSAYNPYNAGTGGYSPGASTGMFPSAAQPINPIIIPKRQAASPPKPRPVVMQTSSGAMVPASSSGQGTPVVSIGTPQTNDALAAALMQGAQPSGPMYNIAEPLGRLAELWSGNRLAQQSEKAKQQQTAADQERRQQAASDLTGWIMGGRQGAPPQSAMAVPEYADALVKYGLTDKTAPTPYSDTAKVNQDFANGLITADQRDAQIAQAQTTDNKMIATDKPIYDPASGKWITPPQEATQTFHMLPSDQVQQMGLDPSVPWGTGPDGKPVPITPPAGAEGWKFGVIGQDTWGNSSYGWTNPQTQEVKPLAPTDGTAASGSASGTPPTTSLYDSLPPEKQKVVDQLLEGRMPFPGSFALKVPYWQQLLAAANDRATALGDPRGFDAVQWSERNGTAKDFTTGGPNSVAGIINNGRTALQHLARLSDEVPALGNWSGIPFLSHLGNVAKNAAAVGTGSKTAQAIAAFDSIRKKYVDEMTRFYRGTGGSEADIQAGVQQLDTAGSPQELYAAMLAQIDLLQSKVNALQTRWHQGMGPYAKDFPIIDEVSQAAIDRLEKNAQQYGISANTPAPPPKPGDMQDGYRFKGGDPAKSDSWEKVQ